MFSVMLAITHARRASGPLWPIARSKELAILVLIISDSPLKISTRAVCRSHSHSSDSGLPTDRRPMR